MRTTTNTTETNRSLTSLDLPIPPIRATVRGIGILIEAGIAFLFPGFVENFLDTAFLLSDPPWYIDQVDELLLNEVFQLLWNGTITLGFLLRYGRLRAVVRDRKEFLSTVVLGCFAATVALGFLGFLTVFILNGGSTISVYLDTPFALAVEIAEALEFEMYAKFGLLCAFIVLSLQSTVARSGEYSDYATFGTEIALSAILLGVWNGIMNSIVYYDHDILFSVYLARGIGDNVTETGFLAFRFALAIALAFIAANAIQKRRSSGDTGKTSAQQVEEAKDISVTPETTVDGGSD